MNDNRVNLTEREYYVLQRKRNHLKLKQVAKYVGCSASMICQHETGVNNLSDMKYKRYKEFINTGGLNIE